MPSFSSLGDFKGTTFFPLENYACKTILRSEVHLESQSTFINIYYNYYVL